ncbi:MAG: hypothetical protein J6X21_05830, partial [Bacteroidaceae bacterium]|nr:hypothetical protein [Bacteroidaceae bacterium]
HEVTASIRIYIGFLSFSFIGFLAMKAFHRLLRMSGIEAKIVNNHHPGTILNRFLFSFRLYYHASKKRT